MYARLIESRSIKLHLRTQTLLFVAAIVPLCLLGLRTAFAGDATWQLNPPVGHPFLEGGDWTAASNWTPATVPNGTADTATFGVSNVTDLFIENTENPGFAFEVQVAGIVFNPGASAYTIFVVNFSNGLLISGGGITNNSGKVQNFAVGEDFSELMFTGHATAGSQTVFDVSGSLNPFGHLDFRENSSADHATFDVRGELFFNNNSTADHGTFTSIGSPTNSSNFGIISFSDNSTAANGNFTVQGGGNNGSDPEAGPGFGGRLEFGSGASAGNGTLIANGGTDGGTGGTIFFFDHSNGGTARAQVFGNGNLDISPHNAPGVTIGSVEGSGNVFLGANNLTVGSNNLSTTFSGVIQDGGQNGGVGGSLNKIGSGTLDLTGANTYTGNTNINGGVLKVDGSITSNTFVNQHGTLSGAGTINGSVTNNYGGTVSPGDASGSTLTVNSYR